MPSVAPSIARLTVRNTGVIARLINEDAHCGFASPAVAAAFTTTGAPGSMGSATWSVDDCAIDLSQNAWQGWNCLAAREIATGKLHISATRTIQGLLTGDATNPVLPLSPYAVTLDIGAAQLDGFTVTTNASPLILTQASGILRAKIHPRLAAAASNGICSIATPNLLITDLKNENVMVRVQGGGHDQQATVTSSDLHAVDGTYMDESNTLTGRIVVGGELTELNASIGGLDPEYNAETFESSYACIPDLAKPVTTTCGGIPSVNLAPQLAEGAARLSIRSFAMIAGIVDQDTRCGFSSAAAAQSATVNGQPGSIGDITVRADRCTIELPANTVVKTSCTGGQTVAQGRITVSGTKKLSGRLTGDPAQPVIPLSDTPAQVEITEASFENFSVEESGLALAMVSGSISGQLVPRIAMDSALHACAIQTPIARFSGVAYAPGSQVTLTVPQGRFNAAIDASNLSAVNGTWNAESNVLHGTITVEGQAFTLPVNANDDGLDPNFNQASFDASWMCGTVDRSAPFECNFVAPLAQGAASLTVFSAGTLANLVDRDTTCGFSSPGVLGAASFSGTVGDPGATASLAITNACELHFPARTPAGQDCNGKATYVEGTASVRGTKTLGGILSGDPAQPIIPTSRDPAVVTLDATLTGFKTWTEPGDGSLEIQSGHLTATIRPRTALDLTTGACSIATPVAALDGVQLTDATVRLTAQGRSFDVHVASANLNAVNGSRDGVTNAISGSIDVDGTMIPIPVAPGVGLDPSYSQPVFDASFACIPNLHVPQSEAECSMKQAIGEGVARLLVAAMGTVTAISNEDDDCGYAANLTDPSSVVGDPGDQGSMEWEIQNCDLERTGRHARDPYSTDCLDRESYFSGVATVSGVRHIDGLRDEISILFFHFDTIVPDTPTAVTVHQQQIALNEVSVYTLDPGQTAPAQKITIHSGTMAATVNPVLGLHHNKRNTYDIPTPIARLTNFTVTNAPVTILYQGKTFNAHVDAASLSAFNGSYAGTGEKNSISGTITLGGQTVTIAPGPLDPGFNQQDFDARYVCTDDLERTVPPAP